MPLKVTSIAARSGDAIQLGPLTVLIGPNNSGKSQTLRDILVFVTSGTTSKLTILANAKVELPSKDEGMSKLIRKPHPTPGHSTYWGVGYNLRQREQFSPQDTWLDGLWTDHNQNQLQNLLHHLGTFWVAHLDAESRFKLTESTASYDTRSEAPSNAIQTFLEAGGPMQEQLRDAFKEAFQKDIALDWAAMSRLYLRVGHNFGEIPDGREALNKLLGTCPTLESQGDGYRSFAGVVLAKLAFADRLLLLDEPEAFLHPAQARALGKWLAEHASKTSTQVILATHSADLLWGIVSANESATVIRLSRTGDTTTYHAVPNTVTKSLVESPLLSSQPVLAALFQSGVVVCEGDPDRAIYSAVAQKHPSSHDADSVAFVHSNGKDAAKTPIELFRQTGTPIAAVVDIDVLNSAQVLSAIYQALTGEDLPAEIETIRQELAAFVESAPEQQLLQQLKVDIDNWSKQPLTEFRSAKKTLIRILKGTRKWEQAKRSGFEHFRTNKILYDRGQKLLSQLSGVGLFIVPTGELEGWLRNAGAKGHAWNRKMLEEISKGQCPDQLVKFVGEIIAFIVRDR